MGIGMEALIMVALIVYIVTQTVMIVVTAWLVKKCMPFYKIVFKQMEELHSSMEKGEA